MNPVQRQLKKNLDWLLWPGLRTIFEIGACQGEDTEFYMRAFSHARLYAFEPLPVNFAALQGLLGRNPEGRGKAWALAMSDSRGEAVLHVSSSVPESPVSRSSSLFEPKGQKPMALSWLKFSDHIKIKTETIDDFCADQGIQKIDFVHVDVQGAELKVLTGARRMLSHIKAIWMEVAFEPTYQGQPLETETTQWMAERGFRKIYQVGYGPEGDALFFNIRQRFFWPRYVMLRLLQRIGFVTR